LKVTALRRIVFHKKQSSLFGVNSALVKSSSNNKAATTDLYLSQTSKKL